MKKTRLLMDMPVTVAVSGPVTESVFEDVYAYFTYIDNTFSTFKKDSEISRINTGVLTPGDASEDMRTVLSLCEETKKDTGGYFDIRRRDGTLDPSGLVKGWAIHHAAGILKTRGYRNYFVDAGGDIETSGANENGVPWTVGIRNPFKKEEIVKVLTISGCGIATSGTYERGQHVYNPKTQKPVTDIVSLTVIASDVLEADRFATAAFAMGRPGIAFLESRPGLEGYMIDVKGRATFTSGFERYVKHV